MDVGYIRAEQKKQSIHFPLMKPSSCKSKGRRFQQKVASAVLDTFPNLHPDDVRSTSMGCGGEDLQLSEAARIALPLSIECKCVERLNVWQCLEQTERNAPQGTTPCLVFSRNRSPTYAILPWKAVLTLYKAQSSTKGIPEHVRNLIQQLAASIDPDLDDPELGNKADPDTENSTLS